MTTADDRAVIDRWWQELVATARLPAAIEFVQGRLVRMVGRGTLPSGPVHVKAMTFPRPKDRLRYALRRLPAAHEARMLRAVAAAGIACPEVIDVRVTRRLGLPFRSLLVLRTLPPAAAADRKSAAERLREEAAIALRLLTAGIVHPDLHRDNFVRTADGSLAVLDLQSARAHRGAASRAARLRVAARLLRDRPGLSDAEALAIGQQCGLMHDAAEVNAVRARVVSERRRHGEGRVRRCLQESTEFTRHLHWTGSEHRLRAGLGEGRWHRGGRALRAAWLGQRILQLEQGRPPVFTGFFGKWWWLGGGGALYVPRACSDERIELEVQSAIAGFARPCGGARGSEGDRT